MEPALSESLMEAVLASKNVRQAWKRVKSNGGAAGVDGITVDEFVGHVRSSWAGTRESLMNGTYQPAPVLRVEIPKKSGGKRTIRTIWDLHLHEKVRYSGRMNRTGAFGTESRNSPEEVGECR